MVTFEQRASGDGAFLIRPNCALGWVWMRRVLWGLIGCIGLVTLGCLSQGAWLVAPFAGLEMGVLALGVYLNARWAAGREVIALQGGELRVLRGRTRLREVARLPRHWTRATLLRDPRGWYPGRLLLECHGRRIEVGRVLVEAERERLACDLRARLAFPAQAEDAAAALAGRLGTAGHEI